MVREEALSGHVESTERLFQRGCEVLWSHVYHNDFHAGVAAKQARRTPPAGDEQDDRYFGTASDLDFDPAAPAWCKVDGDEYARPTHLPALDGIDLERHEFGVPDWIAVLVRHERTHTEKLFAQIGEQDVGRFDALLFVCGKIGQRPTDVGRLGRCAHGIPPLFRVRLKCERLCIDTREHSMGRIGAEEYLVNSASDIRVLVMKVTGVVFLQNAEYFGHLFLFACMDQHVDHVEREILSVVTKDGERAFPLVVGVCLQDSCELLFADVLHGRLLVPHILLSRYFFVKLNFYALESKFFCKILMLSSKRFLSLGGHKFSFFDYFLKIGYPTAMYEFISIFLILQKCTI